MSVGRSELENCSWYIRPIQCDLTLDELDTRETTCELKVKCCTCDNYMYLNDVRQHMIMCRNTEQPLSPSTSAVHEQEPPSTSAVHDQEPPSTSAVHEQEPPSTSAVHEQEPPSTSVVHEQLLPSTSTVYEQLPPSTSAVHEQLPPSTSAVYEQEPPSTSAVHEQEPPSTSTVYEQLPPITSAVYEQLPPSTSAVHEQLLRSTSTVYEQLPPSTSTVYEQLPPSTSTVYEQLPPSTSTVYEQLPPSASTVYEQLPPSAVTDINVNSAYILDSENNYFLVQKSGTEVTLQDVILNCIKEIQEIPITDPIQCLRYIQQKIVTGRKLDIGPEYIETGLSGATNFIMIDRSNLIATALEEVSAITDLRLTLEVDFYGEVAEDYGGPRSEFFSLILPAIQEKYFDPVREYLSEDYESIGKILSLSLLQNGKLPRVFTEGLLQELFNPNSSSQAIHHLRKGMNALGVIDIIEAHPCMIHLITPQSSVPLTIKMVTQLLQPQFSPSGSNRRVIEAAIYQKFIKYLRDIAAGRREGLSLGKVLKFVTGCEEEPPLGFSLKPKIQFTERLSFIPTANTCINTLSLTVTTDIEDAPADDGLFGLFDYAFCNNYFGLA